MTTIIKLLCALNIACAATLLATACAPEEVADREQRYLDCMRNAQYSYYDSIERLRGIQNICIGETK